MSGKVNLFASTPGALLIAYGNDGGNPPQHQNTVVTGVAHKRSITLIYGRPKSGKSFLATHLALTVADPAAQLWMGHRIMQPGPVLYIACEGEGGYWKRLQAAGRIPFQFCLATGRPALIEERQRGYSFAPKADDVLEAIEAVNVRFNTPPVLVVIDTVFRSFGAGNVNDSNNMMAYVTAVGEIMLRGIAVVLVHHATKGNNTPAGSVALMGAADTLIVTETVEGRPGIHTWAIEQSKDDAATDPREFQLEIVTGITDAFGEEVSSCRVVDLGGVSAPKPKGGRPPKGDDEIVLGFLHDVLSRDGQAGIHGVPPGFRAISGTKWRDEVLSRFRPGDAPEAKKKAWQRARNKLQATDRIGVAADWVWATGK